MRIRANSWGNIKGSTSWPIVPHPSLRVWLAVLGLGYVGLPLAVEFWRHFQVVGFDVSSERVAELRASDRVAAPDPDWDPRNPDTATSDAPWRIYNIGADQPVPLMRFIEVLERELGTEAKKKYLPLQSGDVPETHSDISDLARDTEYRPQVSVEEGVRRFVQWYRWYFQI